MYLCNRNGNKQNPVSKIDMVRFLKAPQHVFINGEAHSVEGGWITVPTAKQDEKRSALIGRAREAPFQKEICFRAFTGYQMQQEHKRPDVEVLVRIYGTKATTYAVLWVTVKPYGEPGTYACAAKSVNGWGYHGDSVAVAECFKLLGLEVKNSQGKTKDYSWRGEENEQVRIIGNALVSSLNDEEGLFCITHTAHA